MIDEELYQQAADELNSERRRPHIWARACALASDDHDEARYLYTNLRVEELIAEREKATTRSAPGTESTNEAYSELSLLDVEAGEQVPEADDIDGYLSELSDDSHESELDDTEVQGIALLDDPDQDLMVDYVPEEIESLDDTYASKGTADDTLIIDGPADDSYSGDALAEEDFAQELASFKAEEGEPSELVIDDLPSDANTDSQTIPTLHNRGANAQDSTGSDAEVSGISTETSTGIPDLTAVHSLDLTQANNDLTQANIDVLDAHADDLDEMLGETGYQTPLAEEPDENIRWVDDEPTTGKTTTTPAKKDKPYIYEDDPYTDELSRQADELDLGSTPDRPADYSQQLSDELSQDESFPEPAAAELAASQNAVAAPASVDTSLSMAAATAATSIGTATASLPETSADNATAPRTPATAATAWPMDLTEGDKGKLYSIYRRNSDAQAVRNGVSWSALFFTFPYLVYRHLFGTAFAYGLLWLIVVGGLIISGLAWLDAGASVTPLTQACTIGFALLAFIGLMYLPFRYGNIWRSERLENRGYELVATAKAKNPGRAIARARQHAALDN